MAIGAKSIPSPRSDDLWKTILLQSTSNDSIALIKLNRILVGPNLSVLFS